MSKAQSNREAMPNVAALIDEFRAANPNIKFKVTWARDEQTGVEVGRKDEPKSAFTIPPNYFPSTPVEKKVRRR